MKKFLIFLSIGMGMVLNQYQANAAGPQIAAGDRHTVVLSDDGTVWTWGWNDAGQLGNGTYANSNVPLPVLSNVTAVAAGNKHSLALQDDGTVWAWGSNSNGQIGLEFPTNKPGDPNKNSNIPVLISGLPATASVSALAAGYKHNLVLMDDGTVWAWGFNSQGQLGDDSTSDRNTPLQVSDLTDVTAVAAGYYHSLAITSDGTVWAWGRGEEGQLGNNSTSQSLKPVPVSGLTNVTAVAAGAKHSVALLIDGTVWSWGSNSQGQLGTGPASSDPSPLPAQVSALNDVTAIAAGPEYTMAVREDGTVWIWGSNAANQLDSSGNIEFIASPTPIQVEGLTGVTAVAAGTSHTLVLNEDGAVWSWGRNLEGQLGDQSNVDSATPVQASSDLDLISTQYFTITASSGPNGSISPEGSLEVEGGTDITYTMTPVDGCKVGSVLVDGLEADPLSTYTSPYSYYFYNVDQPHTISAGFTCPVILGTNAYPSIQAAYDEIAPGTVETIKMESTTFAESLSLDNDVTVVLKGGYDDPSSDLQTGWTTISSSSTGPALKISKGKVIIDKIALR